MAYFERLDKDKDNPCRGCDLSCPEHTCKAYQKWVDKNEGSVKEDVKKELEKSEKKVDEWIKNYKRKNKYNRY